MRWKNVEGIRGYKGLRNRKNCLTGTVTYINSKVGRLVLRIVCEILLLEVRFVYLYKDNNERIVFFSLFSVLFQCNKGP